MTKFHYEWWTVEIKFHTGVLVCEYKGKCKESVIRQIKRDFEESNSEKISIVSIGWNRKIKCSKFIGTLLNLTE